MQFFGFCQQKVHRKCVDTGKSFSIHQVLANFDLRVCSFDKLGDYAATFHCVMFADRYLYFIRVFIDTS